MGVVSFYPDCRAILTVVLDGFGDSLADSDKLVIPVLPKSATVHVNSYKQADSYELVFDARDLPFDPRLVRAGQAEIYLFQNQGVNDKNRVLDRRAPLADADPAGTRPRDATETLLLEHNSPIARSVFTLDNQPRIVGLFDDDSLELSESGKWVTISGQDYTAHLISIQWPPLPSGIARPIPTGKRLDVFVTDLVRAADPEGHIGVDVRGVDPSQLPVVGSAETASTTRGIPIEQGTSYWDVIYRTVERYGFIAFVAGADVVISRPKTITDKDTSSIKRLAWGKNLNHLTMKRHLGREQVPTIIVRSYDPRTKQTLSVQYPEGQTIDRSVVLDAKKGKGSATRQHAANVHTNVKEATHVSKKGKVTTTLRERDEYQFVDVFGITDKAVLKQIAENRYHLLGKSERMVIAKTRDLKVETKDSLVDILGVEAGDAFYIQWDEFNAELLADPTIAEAKKVQHLVARGFNTEVAQTIAQYYSLLTGIDRPLRFREGTLTWDVDEGIEIEMELQDFIVIDGVRAGDGANRTPRAQQGAVDGAGKKIGSNFVRRAVGP